MLQTPSLIDSLGDVFLPQARQIWRVIHADFDPRATEFRHEGHQQRGTRRIGSFASTPKAIRQYAQLELGIAAHRILQRSDEVLFRLPNVQRGEKDSSFRRSDSVLRDKYQPLMSGCMLKHGRPPRGKQKCYYLSKHATIP